VRGLAAGIRWKTSAGGIGAIGAGDG